MFGSSSSISFLFFFFLNQFHGFKVYIGVYMFHITLRRIYVLLFFFNFILFNFTILYWFCHIGFRMGNTCIPVADSFWYMANPLLFYIKFRISYLYLQKNKMTEFFLELCWIYGGLLYWIVQSMNVVFISIYLSLLSFF